jgi:DNA-binding response OmpR family regulator
MRLLVVDDREQMARSVHRGLERDGFDVDVALDGTDGLRMAQKRSYDAIVLNLLLPGVAGLELCRRLREAGNWTPILAVTADHSDVERANALNNGVDAFLSRPFAHVVLVAQLRALARRRAHPPPAVITAGDLRLDTSARRCWRSDEAIDLAAREFAVLEYLVRHAGEAVSKRSILEHVWDGLQGGDPNIVEVYVHALRRKIDTPFGTRSIQTLRGAGYRLDP